MVCIIVYTVVPGVWSLVLALPEHWGGQGCAEAALERTMNPASQVMMSLHYVCNYQPVD